MLSQYQFHMTLTGKVPASRRKSILSVLLEAFRRGGMETAVAIDRIALVKQEAPDASFRLISSVPLGGDT